MASIRSRKRKDGGCTYTVYWRDGGRRTDPDATERFGDEDAAKRFRDLVNGYGQKWPPGWVKGVGFVDPNAEPEEPAAPAVDPAHMFERYALHHVSLLTGVEGGTKRKYTRMVSDVMVPWFRDKTIVDGPDAITDDDVKAWLLALKDGTPAPHDPPGRTRRGYAAKTIRDHHGLLSAILA
ncbi:hypothetical protein ACWC5I_27655, partial [Kitasatospora sp. NPDC001574]